MSSKGSRSLLLIVMNAMWVVAVIDVIRVVIGFFGTASSTAWGEKALELTRYLAIPFGMPQPTTPYGGVFDGDAAATVLVLLLAEWVLAMIRRRS
jgi:hypothetical protein